MKSLIITGIIALTISITNCQAQSVNAAIVSLNPINERAVRHFKQNFQEASDERWTVGNDSYRVSFVSGSIKYFVDYHLNGRWRNTIRIYNESHLPFDLQRNIKIGFTDSEIIQVNELRFGKYLAYFVKTRQNGWSKTIQVMDDNVTIIEEFKEL